MNNFRNSFIACTRILFLTALLLGFTISANATTLTVSKLYWGEKVDLVFGVSSSTLTLMKDIDVGEFDVYFDNDSGNILPAYCVDLYDTLKWGTNDVTSLTAPYLYDTTNGKKAEWLMDSFAYNNGKGYSTGGNPHYQAAGLQLAIWEVLYGDNFSYVSTTTELKTDDWYNIFMTELATNYDENKVPSGKYSVAVLYKDGIKSQDLLTLNPVPEPATMLLFGIGLLGISAIGRKKTI